MGADDSLRRQDKSNYDIDPVNRDNSARTLKVNGWMLPEIPGRPLYNP